MNISEKKNLPVSCPSEDPVRAGRRQAAIDYNNAAAGSPEEQEALARYQEFDYYIQAFD